MRFILLFGFVYGLEVLPVCPIKPPEKLVFESNGVVPRTEIKSFEIHESLNHYNPSGDYVGLFVVSVRNSGKWGEYNDIHPGTIIMIDKKDLDGFGWKNEKTILKLFRKVFKYPVAFEKQGNMTPMNHDCINPRYNFCNGWVFIKKWKNKKLSNDLIE